MSNANPKSRIMSSSCGEFENNAAESRTAWNLRQLISRTILGIALAGADVTVARPVNASEANTMISQGGVSVAIQTRSDRVSFCINADENHKISSEFGIEFKLESGNATAWQEAFPKLVTGPDWYFKLPMRVELKTRAKVAGQHLQIELGACSKKANNCDKLDFVASVPEETATAPMKCGE